MWEKEISYGQLTGEIFRRANTLFSGGNYSIGTFTTASPRVQITCCALLKLMLMNRHQTSHCNMTGSRGLILRVQPSSVSRKHLALGRAPECRGCLVLLWEQGLLRACHVTPRMALWPKRTSSEHSTRWQFIFTWTVREFVSFICDIFKWMLRNKCLRKMDAVRLPCALMDHIIHPAK